MLLRMLRSCAQRDGMCLLDEWTALETYLGANGHSGTEGAALKSTSGWALANGTDDFGFSALPGGYRVGSDGYFISAGSYGVWWSSSPSGGSGTAGSAYYRYLGDNDPNIYRALSSPRFGFSVRCLRDAD